MRTVQEALKAAGEPPHLLELIEALPSSTAYQALDACALKEDLLEQFELDLYLYDRRSTVWNPERFGWVLTRNGTHLLMYPAMAGYMDGLLNSQAFEPMPGKPGAKAFWWENDTLIKVSSAVLRRNLLTLPPPLQLLLPYNVAPRGHKCSPGGRAVLEEQLVSSEPFGVLYAEHPLERELEQKLTFELLEVYHQDPRHEKGMLQTWNARRLRGVLAYLKGENEESALEPEPLAPLSATELRLPPKALPPLTSGPLKAFKFD